jgi:transketolase
LRTVCWRLSKLNAYHPRFDADIHNLSADVTLISSGSEVYLINDAAKKLKEQGIKARVVSAPCLEIFDAQPNEYRLSVLPSGMPILAVEAYACGTWLSYGELQGHVVSKDCKQ